MRRSEMLEQLHPKTGYGFVVNFYPVPLGEISQRFPHPHRGIFERRFIEITQRHRNMSTVLEPRRQNRRFLESAHELAHFLVAGKIPYFKCQLYPAGANRVHRKRTTTAPITDMMNPAG